MTLSIARRSDHFPERIGVVDHATDQRVSYAELDDRAETAARRLAARGIDAGDVVAILSRNRVEHLELYFACRRLGATLAPISHRLAADGIEAVGARIDPWTVLFEERFADLAEHVGTGASCSLDAFAATDGQSYQRSVPDRDATSSEPLLYLHTGGTTGVPKVVEISHRQIEWNCITEVAAWGLGNDDVAPILLPLFHTGGWNLLTLPLLYVGGTIVLHREFDPDEVLASIEAHDATRVFGVAAIYRAMAAADRFEETDFSSVKWFLSGGGPTPAEVFESYRERGQRFSQGYGLTEGGPNNLYLDPERDVDPEKRQESVGRPFPDCETRIVDADGESVPTGEIGELEVRGPVTADGYLETEDGTFESTHGGSSSDAWVSTGDLARVDEDGDHYITGRTDNMFVSGGENVYPEEIEDVIDRHPDVDAVGVIGVSHQKWGTVPKAIVEGVDPDDGEDELPEDLEAYCRGRLADFQMPKTVEFVDEIPRSGPGKLDRGALEARYGAMDSDNGTADNGGDDE